MRLTASLRSAASTPAPIDSPHLVKIAATTGSDEVRNSQDMLIARVIPGGARQPHPVVSQLAHLTGTLHAEDGKFRLTDKTTKGQDGTARKRSPEPGRASEFR